MKADGRSISRGKVRQMDDALRQAKENGEDAEPLFTKTYGDWRIIPPEKLNETKLRIWKMHVRDEDSVKLYERYLYEQSRSNH